jgi:hypothetical protein
MRRNRDTEFWVLLAAFAALSLVLVSISARGDELLDMDCGYTCYEAELLQGGLENSKHARDFYCAFAERVCPRSWTDNSTLTKKCDMAIDFCAMAKAWVNALEPTFDHISNVCTE